MHVEITREEVIELLKEVNDNADYENCTTLVDDRVLTSFDLLSIIAQIDDEFDVAIRPKDVTPANFNSAQSIYELIVRLSEED